MNPFRSFPVAQRRLLEFHDVRRGRPVFAWDLLGGDGTETIESLDATYAELLEQGHLSRVFETSSVRDQNGTLYIRTMFVSRDPS